ncbi:L-ribulose-5-phosphate 4-epimerase [Vibrio cortegadensis]|uniref:L-ribulose-5-phosphate 4-epimerase n=1 Tax=Vibrio cortegadensis TaxID=1328770 RepID=UPI0021C27B64|nr:L-ribulose-5-phosphate 4-epimerase [Vibrio cortegadensis]MDN3697275.1 L-ribulose-5-phosphate 4-epimerase [Vibrio cortegadensis]
MSIALDLLRKEVYEANMMLQEHNLITFTWGNVSGVDRENELVVIKPSGVPYEELSPENMVVVNFDGEVIGGGLNPSSDTATHIALYREFKEIAGVVHTHSPKATAWAQSGRNIPALGTTHADYFYGDIMCTRGLNRDEIAQDYELNTGKVIIETIGKNDPMEVPGIIVREHAPFTWGTSPKNAVHNAVVLEEVAKMALDTAMLNPSIEQIPQNLLDKHYLRKHGKDAYYGQNK